MAAASPALVEEPSDYPSTTACTEVPTLVSNFVDTFVDYIVGGQFLPHPSTPQSPHPPSFPTRFPAVDRLIAIGDIHGDLGKAREALRIAGVIDETDAWIGGKTVVVQVGDLLDRGGQELRVIYLLERLGRDARRAGGNVLVMNGNHEIMNMEGDFRYVMQKGSLEFRNWAFWHTQGNRIKEICGISRQPDVFQDIPDSVPEKLRARFAALRPGGPISSRFLASHPTVVMVGSTVFVHGGLLPSHVQYGLEKINEEVRSWILGGKGRFGPKYLHGRDAVVWVRRYSELQQSSCQCDLLEQALDAIYGSKRMIVGHTIQQPFGINGACMNQVIRVDVGMSEGCGNAEPEVLEIMNDQSLRVLGRTSHRDIKITTEKQQFWKQEAVGLGSLLAGSSVK